MADPFEDMTILEVTMAEKFLSRYEVVLENHLLMKATSDEREVGEIGLQFVKHIRAMLLESIEKVETDLEFYNMTRREFGE